ncbi:polysaccharide deacetylase family protein [Nonomuraea recticatena]|uniref:polysaccharide deacetylase family protein n=1 Tax=Nonomuraea recticatena TaxID=46178 RepID=UPI00360F2FD9
MNAGSTGGRESGWRRRLVLLAALLAVLLLVAAGLYQLMNARTFQLAGQLTHRVATTEKVVALTFDDGPDEHTGQIIDVLAEQRVRATFFVIGSQVEARPQDAKALVAAGHQLANHTYSHQRMVFVSPPPWRRRSKGPTRPSAWRVSAARSRSVRRRARSC